MHLDRRLAGPHRQPTEPALTLFCTARLTMNRALIAWLNTCPDPTDLDFEADGTVSIVRQLVALARGGTP